MCTSVRVCVCMCVLHTLSSQHPSGYGEGIPFENHLHLDLLLVGFQLAYQPDVEGRACLRH